MHFLYPPETKTEYRDVIKTVQVQSDTKKEAAKITVVKEVFVPGPPGSKVCEKASVTTTVTEEPKEETSKDTHRQSEVMSLVQTTKKSSYGVGIECPIAGCLDYTRLGIAGRIRLGESPLFFRTTIQPKSLETKIGIDFDF